MKKIIAFSFIISMGTVFYLSCTRIAPEAPDTTNGNCTPKFPGQEVTYNNYVKHILATYCTPTCHNGGSTGPGDFRTYKGVLPYTSQFYYRVIQDKADMPQGNAPLPQTIRDSLNIWLQNCTPLQ